MSGFSWNTLRRRSCQPAVILSPVSSTSAVGSGLIVSPYLAMSHSTQLSVYRKDASRLGGARPAVQRNGLGEDPLMRSYSSSGFSETGCWWNLRTCTQNNYFDQCVVYRGSTAMTLPLLSTARLTFLPSGVETIARLLSRQLIRSQSIDLERF